MTKYLAGDRSIDGADIVLWHTFGPTHFPRVEDRPVMPVDSAKFTLKPYGFFGKNPAMNAPGDALHLCHALGLVVLAASRGTCAAAPELRLPRSGATPTRREMLSRRAVEAFNPGRLDGIDGAHRATRCARFPPTLRAACGPTPPR